MYKEDSLPERLPEAVLQDRCSAVQCKQRVPAMAIDNNQTIDN
jgi:hypothetical protein